LYTSADSGRTADWGLVWKAQRRIANEVGNRESTGRASQRLPRVFEGELAKEIASWFSSLRCREAGVPRSRGWTVKRKDGEIVTVVFPALAGMNRRLAKSPSSW